jgi:hypothetical protein
VPDPLGDLASIALPAFVLGAVTALVQSGNSGARAFVHPGPGLALLEGIAGLVAGALAPCATAAVALAGMLRGCAPFAAAGILATAGLVPSPRFKESTSCAAHDARFGLVALAVGCAALAVRHGSGFVHPRLVPLVWLAVPAALFAARARPATRTRFCALVPAGMLAALIAGSPVPGPGIAAATLDDLYPGEAIAFSGLAKTTGDRITLVRYAITCCRADATAVALSTDLRMRVPPGTWLAIHGTIARDGATTYARTAEWRRILAPADPYLYR